MTYRSQKRRWIFCLALAGAAATPATASDKRDFEACDGLMHPGRQDDGMRNRAEQRFGSIAPSSSASVIAACGRALASPRLLESQSLRRAHLLRARAAAYLQDGNTTAAIADLDTAEAATRALAADRFFKRSMGLSLTLLRGLAFVQSGRMDDAVRLARAAMAERPYALPVQDVGTRILQAARPFGVPSPPSRASLVRIDPTAARALSADEFELGNFAAAITQAAAMRYDWPSKPLSPFAHLGSNSAVEEFIAALLTSLTVAYARAATDDPDGASKELAAAREKALSLTTTEPTPEALAGRDVRAEQRALVERIIEPWEQRIRARIALGEGRFADALSILIASDFRRDAATIDILKSLKMTAKPEQASLVPDHRPILDEVEKLRKSFAPRSAPVALITPETPRAVIDYERARTDILGQLTLGVFTMGISLFQKPDRSDGFRSEKNADGTLNVEYIGNTPSAPLVQEMTLLHSAELARAAGKSAFVITKRQDFSRSMVTSQNGIEMSRKAAGYKTVLTIRLIDSATGDDHALDANAVIDALGPFYYTASTQGG